MIYIFDFDDVLFNNTAQFKKHMFRLIADAGVPENKAREYYLTVSEKEFSLKNFIKTLFTQYRVPPPFSSPYKKIMSECKNFVNTELIKIVKKLGKKNCYMVSNGEKKFQQDKIKNSGIGNLFKKIYTVPNSKKEIIYEVCRKNKNDKVVFVEDKIKFIEDIDPQKCPNLKTILYTGQKLRLT